MLKWILIMVFLPLGIFTFFFLGMLTPLLLLLIPILILQMVRRPDSLKPSKLPKPLVMLLLFTVLPALFAALLLPFRAVFLLLHELPFAWVHAMPSHAILGSLTRQLGSLAWLPNGIDLYQGFCGLTFGLLGSFYDGYWRYRLTQEIVNLPTAKVRSVALGLAELRGYVRHEYTDPHCNDPVIELLGSSQKIKPFYLEDETGRILVDPEGARIRSKNLIRYGGRISEIVLTRRVENVNRWGTPDSGRLMEGDEIYVLGFVEKNTLADPQAPYLIRPKPHSFMDSDFRNLFFLTDAPDTRSRNEIMRGVWAVILTGIIWVTLSTGMIAISLRGLRLLDLT